MSFENLYTEKNDFDDYADWFFEKITHNFRIT